MSTIQCGMTIVMSFVIIQKVYVWCLKGYECPFCDCLNSLREIRGDHGLIGVSFIDQFNSDGSAHKISVNPVGDSSISNK